jgi:hypothetical protein
MLSAQKSPSEYQSASSIQSSAKILSGVQSTEKSMISCASSKSKANALLGALAQYSKSSCKKHHISEQDTAGSLQKDMCFEDEPNQPETIKSLVTQKEPANIQVKFSASAQKSSSSSLGDSSNSFGSLDELRKELIASVMKELSLDMETSSVLSEQTDSSETHEVFKNSALKIRGIDLDNLEDADGKKISIYNLFKARFQQPEYGKARISNQEVVQVVDNLLQKTLTASGRNFIQFDSSDYRKDSYDLAKDKNFTNFQEYWQHAPRRQAAPKQPAKQETIQDFDF